jgi:hypothetical protein
MECSPKQITSSKTAFPYSILIKQKSTNTKFETIPYILADHNGIKLHF